MTPLEWWVLVLLGVLGAAGTWFRAIVAYRESRIRPDAHERAEWIIEKWEELESISLRDGYRATLTALIEEELK